jgi:hypothetical protein
MLARLDGAMMQQQIRQQGLQAPDSDIHHRFVAINEMEITQQSYMEGRQHSVPPYSSRFQGPLYANMPCMSLGCAKRASFDRIPTLRRWRQRQAPRPSRIGALALPGRMAVVRLEKPTLDDMLNRTAIPLHMTCKRNAKYQRLHQVRAKRQTARCLLF